MTRLAECDPGEGTGDKPTIALEGIDGGFVGAPLSRQTDLCREWYQERNQRRREFAGIQVPVVAEPKVSSLVGEDHLSLSWLESIEQSARDHHTTGIARDRERDELGVVDDTEPATVGTADGQAPAPPHHETPEKASSEQNQCRHSLEVTHLVVFGDDRAR